MKVYKVELMIIDFDEVGPDEIEEIIEDTKYPNRCIQPVVIKMESREIGEWDDDHPLNNENQTETFQKLFA